MVSGSKSSRQCALRCLRLADSGRADYKLTSTVMLRVAVDHNVKDAGKGGLNLSGSLTRQREQTMTAAEPSVRRADRPPRSPRTPRAALRLL